VTQQKILSGLLAFALAISAWTEAQGLPKRGIMGKIGSKNPEIDKLILGICQESYKLGFYLMSKTEEPPVTIIPNDEKRYLTSCIDMFSGAFDNCSSNSIDIVGATPVTPLPPQCFGPAHLAIAANGAQRAALQPGITNMTNKPVAKMEMGDNIPPALYVPINGSQTAQELEKSLRYDVFGIQRIKDLEFIETHSARLPIPITQKKDFTRKIENAWPAVLCALIETARNDEEKVDILLKIKELQKKAYIDLEFLLDLFSLGDESFASGYIQSILQDKNSLKNLGFEEAIAHKKKSGSYFKNLDTQIAFEQLAAVLEQMKSKEAYIQKFPASAPIFNTLDRERIRFFKRLIIGGGSFKIVHSDN